MLVSRFSQTTMEMKSFVLADDDAQVRQISAVDKSNLFVESTSQVFQMASLLNKLVDGHKELLFPSASS